MQQQQQNQKQDFQQFTSWINGASPDDTIKAGKQVLARLGSLDQTHRDRFVSEVQSDPAAKQVLEDLTQPA